MIYCIQTEDLEEDLKRVEEMGIAAVDWFPCPWKEEGWT
jgi:hypothetical protein